MSLKSNKRQRTAIDNNNSSHKFLKKITLEPDPQTGLVAFDEFQNIFDKFQIAYIPNVNKLCSITVNQINVGDLSDVFNHLEPEDQQTWTEETWDTGGGQGMGNTGRNDPGAFLDTSSNTVGGTCHPRGYCSFIVQHDKNQLERLLSQLPMVHLPIALDATTCEQKDTTNKIEKLPVQKFQYGPGIWIFFGWNNHEKEDLEGRREHTDAIHHDGTFHYQMSGVKVWHVRPTDELLKDMEDAGKHDDLIVKWTQEKEVELEDGKVQRTKLSIRCSEGDILFINTRLWWHSTTLPCSVTTQEQSCIPSVSYARDVYLGENYDFDNTEKPTHLTNVDGLYAANDIEAGTIIFRESEMPDCELHRTRSNPNCELVELENGEGAVVSCKDIKAGEFFCILDSDEESGSEGDSASDEENEENNDDSEEEEDDDDDENASG